MRTFQSMITINKLLKKINRLFKFSSTVALFYITVLLISHYFYTFEPQNTNNESKARKNTWGSHRYHQY